eukprot:1767195-Pyramimonas_sp.AAC.1
MHTYSVPQIAQVWHQWKHADHNSNIAHDKYHLRHTANLREVEPGYGDLRYIRELPQVWSIPEFRRHATSGLLSVPLEAHS